MCRSRDPRLRVPPECAFENFPLLLGILLRFPKGRPSPLALFSQMEQISPGMLWTPSGAGRGRAVGSCYRRPVPPQRSSSVQCLRSCSSLGTSWQVSAPAVRTRGTLPVRAVKKKLPSSPERSDAPTRPGGGAGSRQGLLCSLSLPASAPCWLSTASPCL